jgi:hypothetical protein
MADNNEKSLKSFWSRPEGKPGMVVLAGLLGVGVYFLYKALPTLLELMKDTLYLTVMGISLFAIFTILMNDRFRTTVWYLYKGLMRWFTGIVIELNPIAILESYVEDIKEKLVKMDEQLQGLKGQMGKINRKLTDKRAEFKLEMERAQQAQKMGRPAEVTLHNRQAGRLKDYIDNMDALSKKMEIMYKVLEKMRYYSEIMIKDTEMTVEIKKEEREAITKSHSVMKSAMNIIKGNDDKKIIFDQAMEFVVDDIGFKVGEMERMLEASSDFISSVDLDNAVYEERGLQMLEQFEQKGMDAIFGNKTALPQGNNYNNLGNFSKTPVPVTYTKESGSEKSGEKKKYF